MDIDEIRSRLQETRRKRLAQLIDEQYGGSQAKFIEETNENQGEVSALLKSKSFGEKKARKLEEKCGLPKHWLDGDLAPFEASEQAREVARAFDALSPALQESIMNVIEGFGVKVARRPSAPALQINVETQHREDRRVPHAKRSEGNSGSS